MLSRAQVSMPEHVPDPGDFSCVGLYMRKAAGCMCVCKMYACILNCVKLGV